MPHKDQAFYEQLISLNLATESIKSHYEAMRMREKSDIEWEDVVHLTEANVHLSKLLLHLGQGADTMEKRKRKPLPPLPKTPDSDG